MLFHCFFGIIVAFSPSFLLIDAAEEAILTPLILQGDLAKAKEKATDNINLSGLEYAIGRPPTSYSGYLTVNETYNSNYFFWSFPAIENPETAPVILFTNSIPGYPVLDGTFLEHGPFYVDENLALRKRDYTWARKHTLIYIESSTAGFTFTDKDEGYAQTAMEQSDKVYEALKQLYTLFPEYQTRDLFIAGSCYAGRVIPKLVLKLQQHDKTSKNLKFNVKGVVLTSPWIAPKLQIKFSDTLLQFGLIDEKQSELFLKEEEVMQQLMDDKKYAEASEQMLKITFNPGALTYTQTGYTYQRNLLQTKRSPEIVNFERFTKSQNLRNVLHVGLKKYVPFNHVAFRKFYDDGGHTDVADFEKILDEGMKVLVLVPQFDFIVPSLGTERTINSLNWKGKEDFKNASRKIWKVDDDIAGYVKSSNNFHYVMLRNAGFLAAMDQPKWCLDMIERFTSGAMF